MVSRAPSTNIWGNTLSDSRIHTAHAYDDDDAAAAGEEDDHTPRSLATSHLPEYNYAQQAASHAAAVAGAQRQQGGSDSHQQSQQPRGPPVWDPSLNSLASSLDPLPQPYRLINSVLLDLLDTAWDAIEAREDEGAGLGAAAARRRRGIVVEGEEEEEEPPRALVQFSAQARLDAGPQAIAELPVAAPARVVAPAFSPNTATGGENRTLQACSASLSIDGRLAIVGSSALASTAGGRGAGGVFIADLARAYAFVYSLSTSPTDGAVSAVAVSNLPVLRGDEDPEGDETETMSNYLLAWAVTSSAPASASASASASAGAAATGTTTIKVATVNAHSWQFFDGCTLHLPVASARSVAATTAVLGAGSNPSAVVRLQFAPDGSHLAVSLADGSHAVYALRAHRFDPALVPPKVSQKEQLLGTGAAAKAGAGRLAPSASAAAAAAAAAAASTAELHSILNDASDFHLHGLSFVEPRSLLTQQAKLYTATLVLHAPVPRALLDSILREVSASSAAAGGRSGTRASSAASNPSGAGVSSKAASKAASPLSPPSKPPRRASLKGDMPSPLSPPLSSASASAGTPPAAPLSPSAAASVAASPRPVSATPAAAPACSAAAASRTCVAPSSIHFLCSAPPRRLGSAPPAVAPARGFIVAWERDCAWHRWELGAVKPVEAGQSSAALALLAARPKTPGQIAPGSAAGATGAAGKEKEAGKSGKASKHDASAAAAAAAAAAAVFPGLTAAETALCLRPLPAACSTVVGSGVCAAAIDVSGSFLAVGLACGTVVLYDCRVGGVRLQVHGTPVTSHGALDAFSSASSASPARVTSLAWFGCSHLVAGLGDCTVRTFFLPPNLERQGSDRLGADANVAVRVSTKLPGGSAGVCSVRIGTKLPLALVGVSSSTAAADKPSQSQQQQPQQQMFFVYDFLSNHIIGRLLPNGSSGGGAVGHSNGSNPASPGRFSGAGGGGVGLSSPMSRTREFTVYEEKDDSGGFARLSSLTSTSDSQLQMQMQLRASNDGDYTERSSADEGAYSFRGLGHGIGGGSGGESSTASATSTTSFHPLSLANGCFATLAADQIVVLGCSSSPASASASGSAGSSASLLIYPVSDLIVSLYPSISSSCSNAFLCQQHAQAFFAEHPLHADRRAPAAFANYLSALDAAVAASNQEALTKAFAQGRSGQIKASYAGSSAGRGGGGGHSRKPSNGSFSGGGGAAAAAGRSRAYHPLLSSIHSRSGSVTSSTGGEGDRLGVPAGASHARKGSSSSVASHVRTGSSASQQASRHARSSSRSPERTRPAVAADPLPANLPRDAAFLMHAALAATVTSSAARSPAALKARRAEMAAQLKAEAQQQQRASRFGGALRAQQTQHTLVLPRILQAQR